MNTSGLVAAVKALDNEDDGTKHTGVIFKEIAEKGRVNYYELESAVEEKSGEHKRAEIKEEIQKTVEVLKKRKWIGELVLPDDELNVYYLTAEGSLAADDDY
jgi:hypothetical protein